MKKFKYEFEIDDDFEVGCCFDCPLHEWVDYDDGDGYSETYLRCVINSSFESCPLQEVESDMVYCTNCNWFRLCDEGLPYCIFENKCDIKDCEDSKSKEDRPCYEERLR